MAVPSTPNGFCGSALAAILLLSSCEGSAQDERQQEQRLVRAQRLSRARAQRARLARRQRLRKRQTPRPAAPAGRPTSPGPGVTADGPCTPATSLRRRVKASGFNDRLGQAVRLVLTPIRADVIKLAGKTYQRFTITVRMHPGDAPRFGRPKRRAILALDLRFTPLCKTGKPTFVDEKLRLRLVRRKHRKLHPVTSSLWPERRDARPFMVPVGMPLQLLLDPTRPTLRPGARAAGVEVIRGIWEIRGARFVGRPRTQRLSLATSALPDSLRQLHVVEVKCGQGDKKRCRFLTRQRDRMAVVTPWKKLVAMAAPLRSAPAVRQLHAAELRLRFAECGGDTRRAAKNRRRHRCFRQSAKWLPCQFWRAQGGYGNEALITAQGDGFHVQHVIACTLKKLRVLRLEATYERKGRHSLTVTDLTPRASKLLDQLRRLTSRRRRRR